VLNETTRETEQFKRDIEHKDLEITFLTGELDRAWNTIRLGIVKSILESDVKSGPRPEPQEEPKPRPSFLGSFQFRRKK